MVTITLISGSLPLELGLHGLLQREVHALRHGVADGGEEHLVRMRVGVRFRDRVRARAKARVSQLACRGEQHRARREHLAPPVEGRGVVRLCRQQGVSRG